ncbi:adenosylcobinamide-phosphate synthase CbiB [Coleofasciculus sp. FACHB-1120]|uniref:adenosylcobinamide-phosphate synthase CbiB n=1 Tax=Coleofasciculus sp. FACHB-1120 TaxID=2692783 RepID=UPI0016838858|nr:adenosylcobinamide-phosphate synthase CbiB [Coleofasciculus sp. FACHB-1120]MBD2743183.1 cobalamin biosynthesis protein [Coleofasciculus sp. FACHB-1120]
MTLAAGKQPKAKKPVLLYRNCQRISSSFGVVNFQDLFAAVPIPHPSVLSLAIASLLDYIIGDPWGWPHPVRVMGGLISRYSQMTFGLFSHPLMLRWAGVFLGIGLITGSYWMGWLIVQAANWVHPFLGIVIESILLASCFAGRSLRAAAEDVLQPLNENDLVRARSKLSQYVGRDTENLQKTEILRAVLETVTENATDGVMAPLFYAIIGTFLPILGTVPLALAYKAASTLDSMVGYREAPYTDLGWFSAKLEDILTWLPCRFTVITLALLSRKPGYVWRICQRDATKDPSPNSGWSECAYAAILGVQVGGTNWYRGVAKHKALLGDDLQPINAECIQRALQLTRYNFLIWLGIAIAILLLLEFRSGRSLGINWMTF